MKNNKRVLAIALKNEHQYKDEQLYKALSVVYSVKYFVINDDKTVNSNNFMGNVEVIVVPKEIDMNESTLLSFIESFLRIGKEVWCYKNVSEHALNYLRKFRDFKYTNAFLQNLQDAYTFKTTAPVIFIYGNSTYASQNYVNLRLCKAFERIGAKVSSFSVEYYADLVNQISLFEIYNQDYTIDEKQNICIKRLMEVEEGTHPDVYIFSIPQSNYIPENNIKSNGIIETIVSPDYTICTLINYNYDQAYLEKIEKNGINGANVDYYYLGDNSINILNDEAEVVHSGVLNHQNTLSIIKNNERIFAKLIEGYDDSEFEKVVNDFVKKFSKNKYILI